VFWYTRASVGLSGFARTWLEKPIKDAGDEALAIAADQTRGDSILAPGVVMRLVKIPPSKDGKIIAVAGDERSDTKSGQAASLKFGRFSRSRRRIEQRGRILRDRKRKSRRS
jgi:hypothetical protein